MLFFFVHKVLNFNFEGLGPSVVHFVLILCAKVFQNGYDYILVYFV